MSYLDVFDVQLPTYEHDISPGDLVALGENAGPLYEVVAVRAEKAWVRGVIQGADFLVQGSDFLVSVQRCRRIGPNAADTLH
jgi:hypothetical protein